MGEDILGLNSGADDILPGGSVFTVTSYGAVGSGTVDDRPAIQAAVDAAFAAGGGIIQFPQGTYLLDSGGPITISPNRTGEAWLQFVGYGATIKIGPNQSVGGAAKGFLKFKGSGSTVTPSGAFKNIRIAGFRVDFNSQGTRGVAIIGNTVSPDLTYHADYENILIEDIYSFNVPQATTFPTNNIPHIYIQSRHAGQGESQNTIKSVTCRNVKMTGGVQGVFVGGTVDGGTGCEVYFDRILYTDCFHDYLATFTTATGSNFQVGSQGFGDRVVIERCEGRFGNDTSFEVNATQQLVYRDCVSRDGRSANFYARDFHTPQSAQQKSWLIEGCRVLIDNVTPDNAGSAGYDCRGIVIGATTTDAFGRVTVRDYLYECSTAMLYNGDAGNGSNTNQGHAIYLLGSTCKSLKLENVEVRETNIALDTTVKGGTFAPISIRPRNTDSEKMRLVMDGVHIKQAGAISAIPNAWTYVGANVSVDPSGANADISVDIRDFDVNFQLPSNGSYAWIGMSLGTTSGIITTLRGVVRRFYVISGVATTGGSIGLRVGAPDRCTIDKTLVLESCNFSNIGTNNNEIQISGVGTNMPSIVMRDCTLRATSTLAGVAPISVTVSASPFVYQNLDGIRQQVFVTGGTVSDVSVSRDNVTFGSIAAATGVQVALEPGHAVKVTYTVAPTMTKQLLR